MTILNQKRDMVFLPHGGCIFVYKDEIYHSDTEGTHNLIGRYETDERAREVFDQIIRFMDNPSMKDRLLEMPED